MKCLPDKVTSVNTDNTENINLESIIQENNISIQAETQIFEMLKRVYWCRWTRDGIKITEEEEKIAQPRHKKAQSRRYGKNVIYFKFNAI